MELEIQERDVERLLIALGLEPWRCGYIYLEASLLILWEEPQKLHSLGKEVFGPVAAQFGVEASSVETAIRNLIIHWWARAKGGPAARQMKCSQKPSARDFIARILILLRYAGRPRGDHGAA